MTTHPFVTPSQLSPQRRAAVLIALLLMTFVASANASAIAPLLPTIGTTFHLSIAQTGWIFTSMFLAGGVSTVLLPRAGDVLGDKLAAAICPIGLTAGCAMIGLADAFPLLILGAVGLGLAGAASPVVMASIRRIAGEGEIGRAVAVTMAVGLAGGAVGQVLGGWAVGRFSLSSYFVVLAVIALAVSVTVFVALPTMRASERGHLGSISVLLLAAWIVAILYGISKGTEWGWTDAKTIGTTGAGLAIAALWAIRERRLETPVIDFSLFTYGRLRITVLAALALGLPTSGLVLLLPMITQTSPAVAPYGLGKTALTTALIMLPYALCGAVGTSVAGKATAKGRPLTVAALGAVAHGGAATWLAFMHGSVGQLVTGTVIYGVGAGLVTGGLYGSVQKAVEPRHAGMAAGTLSLALTFSAAIGPVVFTTLLGRRSVPKYPGVPTDAMFTQAFLVSTCFELLVLAACLTGLRQERRGDLPFSAPEESGKALSLS
ncbi:MFS transporter [Streptomyces chartreusis]|uniref:MFS transporter n=1 Tax=Streptomyces chartreusis TaxID=1969 RepID=UPI00362CACD9